jgi:hypothetical protein
MTAIASSTMPRRLPPGCVEDRDRHGNVRIYYRAKGRLKVRLRGTPWTPQFLVEYDAAKRQAVPITSKGTTPGTWRWLCVSYFAECADYLRLDQRTRRVRRGILEATFDEPVAPGSSKFFRDFPLSRMSADAVEVLRDRKLALPILPALQRVIDSSLCGELAFLVNDLGRPFTDAGFGNKFREWCGSTSRLGFRLRPLNCVNVILLWQPSGPAPLHGPRLAQGGRDYRSKQRRHGAPTHGDLRLGHSQNGGSLHPRRRSRTLGRGRNAHARNARTKQNKIESHQGRQWDFFRINSKRTNGKFR